ncbi:MAG: arylsulfotransferase family protein [Pseudomonadota bacterium]
MTQDQDDKIARAVSKAAGILIVAGLIFGLGAYAGRTNAWPLSAVRDAVGIVRSLILEGEVIPDARRAPAPQGASRDRVTVHDAAASMGAGHYALLGWDVAAGHYGLFFHDAAGTLLHTIPIDEMTFEPRAEHNSNAPHAMQMLPDGSVLVSFDWIGTVARLDACGVPIWQREGFYHHSFEPAADGGIWTWWGELTAYGQIQDILKFDPETGEDMVRLSFTEDVVMRDAASALLYSFLPGARFTPDDRDPRDIFHPNDAEELMPEMAAAFPMFEAGDLMLSIRELDLVTVIDPATGETKWSQQGPWLKQHDPDFLPDGTISVYNNSRFRANSSIMVIDPATREVTNPIPALDVPFKSAFRGKHQYLPNGNILITIPEQGQVLEVAPPGTVAVEFNNPAAREGFNEDIVNAKWYPPGYFETLPACEG